MEMTYMWSYDGSVSDSLMKRGGKDEALTGVDVKNGGGYNKVRFGGRRGKS